MTAILPPSIVGNVSEPRECVTVIVSHVQENPCFHFCSIPLLQGENCNLQWPVNPALSLFENIELVMILNGIANNVTRLDFVQAQGQSRDYQVIYNKPLMHGKHA
jgi:hypothetical protein